jgi:hypothetical protein
MATETTLPTIWHMPDEMISTWGLLRDGHSAFIVIPRARC